MELPPPAAVAGRLVRTLAVHPYRMLRPFLTEDVGPEAGVTGQILGIVAGVLSFAVVVLGVLAAAGGTAAYTFVFYCLRVPLMVVGAVSDRR